jgi:hypothetical protein
MGEQNADLLGSILVTKMYLSAMSRAEETASGLAKLPPFYLYVDEFHSVVNDSFANILSEARKYKLALIIAHQYVEQVEENIRNAVFGNVGTTITFRVGPFDADTLETMYKPTFLADDIINLGFAQIYLTLMIDGIGSAPFSARTLEPINTPKKIFVDEILAYSRAKYAVPRAEVEKFIESTELPQKIKSKVNNNKPKQQYSNSKPSKYQKNTQQNGAKRLQNHQVGTLNKSMQRKYKNTQLPVETKRNTQDKKIIDKQKTSLQNAIQNAIKRKPRQKIRTNTAVKDMVKKDAKIKQEISDKDLQTFLNKG